MGKDEIEIEMAAPADEVWKKVGDFGAVGDFFPGIDSVALEGEDRVIGMLGMEVRERLIERDEKQRSLTYAVVEGVPVDRHRATVEVVEAGDGGGCCRVTWSFEVVPDEMAPIFADIYRKALEALRDQLA